MSSSNHESFTTPMQYTEQGLVTKTREHAVAAENSCKRKLVKCLYSTMRMHLLDRLNRLQLDGLHLLILHGLNLHGTLLIHDSRGLQTRRL